MLKIIADYSDSVRDAVNDIPHNTGDGDTIKTILNFAYSIAGLVAVAVIVYAGISYLTSSGDPAKARKATQALLFAVVGLIIVLFAAVITNYVIGGLE